MIVNAYPRDPVPQREYFLQILPFGGADIRMFSALRLRREDIIA